MISLRRYLHAARRINKHLVMLSVLGLVYISTKLDGYAEHANVVSPVQVQDAAFPLVVAPEILYSTYLGGVNASPFSEDRDSGNDIAVDAAGNIYVVGTANTLARYDSDVFVRKFDPSGSTLLYETFLDSNETNDKGYGIAVDTAGNAYITGQFGDPFLPGFALGVLVAKLNPAGIPLYQVTFGANSPGYSLDFGADIAVDDKGNAFVVGTTYGLGTSFPTTPGAFQRNFGAGLTDAFVVKLNPSGQFIYSTLLGGMGPDEGRGIAIRKVGGGYHAYVTGTTSSPGFDVPDNFPTTPGSFQPEFGGAADVFVTQFNDTGSALVYSTYLGGNGLDEGYAIAVDAVGNAYLTGLTSAEPSTGSQFPISNAFQSTYGGEGGATPAEANAFVTKLNPTGSALVYSSYMGGGGYGLSDAGIAIKVDGEGYAYLTGITGTRPDIFTGDRFPIVNAFQTEPGGGFSSYFNDAFVAKLTPQGALVYSSYLGGSDEEVGNGIAIDASGNVYVTGATHSVDFPITPGAFQAEIAGGGCSYPFFCPDALVTKIGNNTPPNLTLTVTKAGAGIGTVTATGIACGADCSGSYTPGTVVTLTATPTASSIFAGWSGDPDCHDGSVTMNANKTCTATFSVVSSAPITVTTPNGGEICVRGKPCMITWTATIPGKVKIEVSYDSGQSWVTVLKSTVNDGHHRWRTKGVPTTQARIRVSSIPVPSLFDVSDGNFVIQ